MDALCFVAIATSTLVASNAPESTSPAAQTDSAVAAPTASQTEALPPPDDEPPARKAEPKKAEPKSKRGDWRRPPTPPRVDGAYLGAAFYGAASLVRVNKLDTTGSPFAGFGGHARVGQMVLPWLGLGLMVGGSLGVRSERSMGGVRQRLGLGALAVDITFAPIPKVPWTVRTAFGFGGGAVRQAGVGARAGFGGAVFSAGTRYELFPFARRFRPTRGGGFGVGPELGWLGSLPAAAGRPMAHVLYLGLSTTIYFGE